MTLAVAATNVLTINPSVPARNLGDLIALIKSNPGKYNYASGGVGTQAHLLGEMLRLSLALDIVHVPFNGGGPEIASIVAGHTPIGWSALVSAAQQIKAGQLLALAITRSFCPCRAGVGSSVPLASLFWPQGRHPAHNAASDGAISEHHGSGGRGCYHC